MPSLIFWPTSLLNINKSPRSIVLSTHFPSSSLPLLSSRGLVLKRQELMTLASYLLGRFQQHKHTAYCLWLFPNISNILFLVFGKVTGNTCPTSIFSPLVSKNRSRWNYANIVLTFAIPCLLLDISSSREIVMRRKSCSCPDFCLGRSRYCRREAREWSFLPLEDEASLCLRNSKQSWPWVWLRSRKELIDWSTESHPSANRRKPEGATRLPKDFGHREKVSKHKQKENFKLGAKCSFFKVTNMKYQRIITKPTCLWQVTCKQRSEYKKGIINLNQSIDYMLL